MGNAQLIIGYSGAPSNTAYTAFKVAAHSSQRSLGTSSLIVIVWEQTKAIWTHLSISISELYRVHSAKCMNSEYICVVMEKYYLQGLFRKKRHFKRQIYWDLKRGTLTIRFFSWVLDGAAFSLCMGAGGLAGVQPVGLRFGGLPAAKMYGQAVKITKRLTKHEHTN